MRQILTYLTFCYLSKIYTQHEYFNNKKNFATSKGPDQLFRTQPDHKVEPSLDN